MKKEKTNYDHLVDLLKDNDEALEFLGAMKSELDEAIKDADDNLDSAKVWEERWNDANSEIADLQDTELGSEIDCGIGKITYETDNMVLDQVMEALAENIKRSNPQAVLNLLDSINTYA